MEKIRVPQNSAAKGRMRLRTMRGFSFVELMIVVVIGLTVTGFALMTFRSAEQGAAVTSGFNSTLQTIRRAREEAVAERRTWVVAFTAPNTITLSKDGALPGGILVSTTTLPTNVAFTAIAGLPNPGPDGFGTGINPVDFGQPAGGGTSIYFQPDGSAQDAVGNINNGVIYIAQPGLLPSSKAITLWGTTGRIRGWTLGAGNVWSQR